MLTSLVDKVERVFVIGTPLSRVSNGEWRAAYKVLPFDPVRLLNTCSALRDRAAADCSVVGRGHRLSSGHA
jgi:hypothetical protein